MRLEYENTNGENKGPEALYNARKRDRANRQEYTMRSPDDGLDYLPRSSDKWRQAERRLHAMGINNYEEYIFEIIDDNLNLDDKSDKILKKN